MSLINPKQDAKLFFMLRPEELPIYAEKYEAGENEYNLNSDDEELAGDDENDINGDDAENTEIYNARIFYMTHRESAEIDPAYK